jgi:hypothetical protein
MTKARKERNVEIKQQVKDELENGLLLKQATYVVAEKYFLSRKHVERIYYETMLEEAE